MTSQQPNSYPQSTPHINPAYWGFMLGGFVRVPLMLSYADVLTLPAVDITCTLSCAGNIPGARYFHSAAWRGVSLQTLLEMVELYPKAQHAHFFAADDYSTSISLERLRGAALAYSLNGEPLTHEQGAPVRLIVPGLNGYKMPKWIQRIELREEPLQGTWESLGWSVEGVQRTTSVITSPLHLATVNGAIALTGTAHAGERFITGIEVSVSHGAWMPVEFTPQATPHDVVQWSITWSPPATGQYRIKVRATDSEGFTQAEGTHDPSRVHAITVHVVEAGT